MFFIWSGINRYEVLFVLVFCILTHVLCGGPNSNYIFAYIGFDYNFTCPVDLTTNHTYKFEKGDKVITPNGRIKQYNNTLTITSLQRGDAGLYYCSAYSNGIMIENTRRYLGHLIPGDKPSFEIAPKGSVGVNLGTSFEFRCEYGKRSTRMMWKRQRTINGTKAVDDIPSNLIKVISDSTKSVEVYFIKKVTSKDSGSYKCAVTENGRSRETGVAVLQVNANQRPQFKNVKSVFVVNQGEKLNILFEVSGTPTANITCYRKDIKVLFCPGRKIDSTGVSSNTPACLNDDYVFTGTHELIIEKVTFVGNDGKYRCEASNVVGSHDVSFRVNVTVPPEISRAGSEIFSAEKTREGSVICKIRSANPRPNVKWSQQDLKRVEDESIEKDWVVSQYLSKLTIGPQGRYESTLTIPWNKEQSLYRCFVKNDYGNDTRVFKFIRYGQGKEPFVICPRSPVIKNEGQTVEVQCRVISVFGANIGFLREDRMIISNNSRTTIVVTSDDNFYNIRMIIRNLNVNDSGRYQCSETDGLTNYYASLNLTVKALRPPVILSLQNKTVNKEKDKNVVLFCNVTGNPYPKVKWFKDGEPTEAKLVRESCNGQKSGYYFKNNEHTQLAICEIDLKHTALYTCFVENQLGNDTKVVYLNVTAKPRFIRPTSLKKEYLNIGQPFTYRCMVEGNPTPWVQWLMKSNRRKMTDKSLEESTLNIKEMNETYVGNYSCKAWNSLGGIENHFLELTLNVENDPSPVPGGGGGMPAGTIAGIVTAIVVLVVAVFFIIFLYYRRQQKKLLFYKHQYFLKTGDYAVDPSLTLNEQSMNLPYDSDWEFPFERLVVGERLGAGAFGEVYKAEAMGILALNPRDKSSIASKRRSKIRRSLRASQRPKKKTIPPDLSNAIVAVKTVKAQATESEIRDLAAELKLMIHIGEHKNIVNLLGACTTGRKLFVILEFCPHGNLLHFLRSKREIYNNSWVKEIFNPEKEFTLIDIVGAAFQIAKGMEFLASRKLIHRDLAARNILVADEYVMKISDFGLARDIYKSDLYVKTSSGMLPVKWMAVESLFDRVYTHQSDVWSFGVLLWEMMTLGGTPYPNLPAEELLDFLNEGKRMKQPNKCPLEVYTIMRDCWRDQPEERPTFSNLVEHLGRILERHIEKVNPYVRVEASAEEVEAAKEKDELLKTKSDYYLQPLLLSNRLAGYDSNAPLPTPPTDTYQEATAPLPEVNTKPSAPGLSAAGSYALLTEDTPSLRPLNHENDIGLKDMNNKNHEDKNDFPQKVESVV